MSQTFDNEDVRANAAEDLQRLTGAVHDDDRWDILRQSIIVQEKRKKWWIGFYDGTERRVLRWIDSSSTMSAEEKERAVKTFLTTLQKPLVDST